LKPLRMRLWFFSQGKNPELCAGLSAKLAFELYLRFLMGTKFSSLVSFELVKDGRDPSNKPDAGSSVRLLFGQDCWDLRVVLE
jgi:hypothetical protein